MRPRVVVLLLETHFRTRFSLWWVGAIVRPIGIMNLEMMHTVNESVMVTQLGITGILNVPVLARDWNVFPSISWTSH